MQKYRLWCRRNNDPDSLWTALSYAPRYLPECEDLLHVYEEEWGSFYQYKIVPVRFFPPGLREPVFV